MSSQDCSPSAECVRRGLPLILVLFALNASGCGASDQKFDSTPQVIPTAADNLRQTLQGLAESGQTDSGTELLKGEVEKLRGTTGVDADSLLKDVDFLLSGKPAPQVQAKAKEMLGKLPK